MSEIRVRRGGIGGFANQGQGRGQGQGGGKGRGQSSDGGTGAGDGRGNSGGGRGGGGGVSGGGKGGGPPPGGASLQMAYNQHQADNGANASWTFGAWGIASGDFLVLLDRAIGAFNESAAALVTPTGWTNVHYYGDKQSGFWPYSQAMHYKLADGTENSSAHNMMNATGASLRRLLVFRPSQGSISTIHLLSDELELILGDPSSDTLSYSSYDSQVPLVGIGYVATGHTDLDPVTYDPSPNAYGNAAYNANGGARSYLGADIVNATGTKANTTVDMVDENQANTVAHAIFGFNRS